MIAHISGTILEKSEKELVITAGGIGYSIATIPQPFEIGQTISLYTHMVVKDDAHELYGFTERRERDFFKILIGVSGVGPKTALHMLTLYPLSVLAGLIKDKDAKAIALVPGIGKKTAEKIVIDLKDKVEGFLGGEHTGNTDLVEALLSLGYKDSQIRAVAHTIDKKLPIEKQITEALQKMQK